MPGPNSRWNEDNRRVFPASVLTKRKIVLTTLLCLAVGVVLAYYAGTAGQAQEKPNYVGSEVCAGCHADVAKTWQLTVHRRTLFNTKPELKGCESCHGPGGNHVAGGGDVTKIIRLSKLSAEQVADSCLKCHNQSGVTLWHTGTHARSKLSCLNCHDPHQPGAKVVLKDIDNGKLELDGLTRAIQQAQLEANTAPVGSKAKEEANARIAQLQAQSDKLRGQIKGQETVYRRTAEPYLCYNCHKSKQVQSKMPSHHPMEEGKVNCTSCHNPHGGPKGLLREDSVVNTCQRCHAEKAGPFIFQHPPVAQDCTICHNPHGSVQNNLLVQSQPFLCMKCHPGPHSRSNALGTGANFAKYNSACTDCHAAIHGSDVHAALHY
jgi:predicted CXXCH cytochrome family protein